MGESVGNHEAFSLPFKKGSSDGANLSDFKSSDVLWL